MTDDDDDDEDGDDDDDDMVVVVVMMVCNDEWDSLWRFRSIVVVVPSSSSLYSGRWKVVAVSCLSLSLQVDRECFIFSGKRDRPNKKLIR